MCLPSLERHECHQYGCGANAPDKCSKAQEALQFGLLERIGMLAEHLILQLCCRGCGVTTLLWDGGAHSVSQGWG